MNSNEISYYDLPNKLLPSGSKNIDSKTLIDEKNQETTCFFNFNDIKNILGQTDFNPSNNDIFTIEQINKEMINALENAKRSNELTGTDLIKISATPDTPENRAKAWLYSETIDGKIDATEQGDTGDCWVLSGINSLSYTKEGQEIIKDALEYRDGYTIVHFATGDYAIKDDEVALTKADGQYSDGDDDMIILELAVEKYLDEVANGDIESRGPNLSTRENRKATIDYQSSMEGGFETELWYLLTGQMGDINSSKEKKQEAFEQFEESQKNGQENIVLTAAIFFENLERNIDNGLVKLDKDAKVWHYILTDINGKEVALGASHAYAIKSIDGDNVTFTNPWDSGEEVTISKEDALNLFGEICVLNLSTSKQEDLTTFSTTNIDGKKVTYDDRKVFYDNNGNKSIVEYSDDDGIKRAAEKYDSSGNLIEIIEFNSDGTVKQRKNMITAEI